MPAMVSTCSAGNRIWNSRMWFEGELDPGLYRRCDRAVSCDGAFNSVTALASRFCKPPCIRVATHGCPDSKYYCMLMTRSRDGAQRHHSWGGAYDGITRSLA